MTITEELFNKIIEISDQVKNLGKDLTPILPALAEIFASSIDTNTLVGGRWDGDVSNIGLFSGGSQKWAPLAESTKKGYLKRGITNLQRTLNRNAGGLQSSIEILPIGKSSIKFGIKSGSSPKIYAAIQNFGGTIMIKEKKRTLRFRYSDTGATLFVKKKAKGKGLFDQDVTIPAHQIKIPASPYLVLQQEDLELAYEILTDYLQNNL